MSRFILIFFLIVGTGFSQTPPFNNQWESVGPNEKPYSPNKRADLGIGPVEFIRANESKQGYLLAGSLNGGLFYTEDGGELWINSGSDRWDYSGCAWADYYPKDEKIWFAVSNKMDNNGKPGQIGEKGGLYRTKDQGLDWDLIGGIKQFGGSKYTKIYGTRFHPNNEKVLYVMTSNGIYYTENCLANYVSWKLIPNLKGWIYDLDFLNNAMYVSNFYKGKWSVLKFKLNDYTSYAKIVGFENINDPKRSVTFEPTVNSLFVLIDYKSKKDEVWEYNSNTGLAQVVLNNQTVNFGSGHTFAINPNDSEEFYIGASTMIRKYEKLDGVYRSARIASGYHVDIEFVVYDPFDTNRVYLASHGGVFVSEDNGASWESKSYGLGIAEVMGLDVSELNPNQMVIGCFHDGSSVLADFDQNGNYYWRMVNGGDALIPIIDPNNPNVVYTSNQYRGGGIYYSNDTAKKNINIHQINRQKTSGWEIAATLHPEETNILFYNFLHTKGESNGNIDACRTIDASERKTSDTISDFKATHNLEKYKVFGLFNSASFPDDLYAYVLHFVKDENGKNKTNHLLFKTDKARANSDEIINSWNQLEIPRNTWVADVEMDPVSSDIVYISYTTPKENPESIFGDKGLVYALKYSSKNYRLKREYDITRNIPSSLVGRYNLEIPTGGKKQMFIATRAGVYYGSAKSMKGKRRWYKIGTGLPHCKPFGLNYNEKNKVLTVGLLGRGVWRYYFN